MNNKISEQQQQQQKKQQQQHRQKKQQQHQQQQQQQQQQHCQAQKNMDTSNVKKSKNGINIGIINNISSSNQRVTRHTPLSTSSSLYATEIVRGLFGPSISTVVASFTCSLHRQSGRLYIASNALCFYSNIFGFERKLLIRFQDVVVAVKIKSSSVLVKTKSTPASGAVWYDHNATVGQLERKEEDTNGSICKEEEHIFRSFDDRDAVLDVLIELRAKFSGDTAATEILKSNTSDEYLASSNSRGGNKHVVAAHARATAATSFNESEVSATATSTATGKTGIVHTPNRHNRVRSKSFDRQKNQHISTEPQRRLLISHQNLKYQRCSSERMSRSPSPAFPLDRRRLLSDWSASSSPSLSDRSKEKSNVITDFKQERVPSLNQNALSASTSNPTLSQMGESKTTENSDAIKKDEYEKNNSLGLATPQSLERSKESDSPAVKVPPSLDKEKCDEKKLLPTSKSLVQQQLAVSTTLKTLNSWESTKKSVSLKEVALKNHIISSCSSLDSFFRSFLADDAPHSIEKFQREVIGDFDVSTSPWTTISCLENALDDDDDDDNLAEGKEQYQRRTTTFKHPLNSTFGPSSVDTTRTQKITSFGSIGMRVDSVTVIKGAPGADCFQVEEQWLIESISVPSTLSVSRNETPAASAYCGEEKVVDDEGNDDGNEDDFIEAEVLKNQNQQCIEEKSISFSVNFEVKFIKPTMLKRIIEKQTREETIAWFQSYVTMLKHICIEDMTDCIRNNSDDDVSVEQTLEEKKNIAASNTTLRKDERRNENLTFSDQLIFILLVLIFILSIKIFVLNRRIDLLENKLISLKSEYVASFDQLQTEMKKIMES